MDVLSEAVRLIILTTIAFVIALVTTPLWVKFLERGGWMKKIRTRTEAPVFNKFHEKKAGTLTGGGIIIWTTVAGLAIFFFLGHLLFDGYFDYLNFVDRGETYLPLAALLLAGLLGFADDWFGIKGRGGGNGGGMKVRHKLVIYALAAAIGAWWFYVKLEWDIITVPFFGTYEIGGWMIPIFMFIIIASAFSANETDGLDGLLGGTALFAFAALTTVAFVLGRYDLAVFGGMIIGSLLAFLWFNIYPAKFFMGDTGSMALGITMGVVAMLTNTILLLPLFALILVIESLSVLLQFASKRFRGKKIFLSTPLHHHFEALGWPESQITMRFWIVSVMGSALGLVVFFLSRFVF